MRFFGTTNYDDFVFVEGNRDIEESNVNRFKRILEEGGDIWDEVQVNPTKVNGKWPIIDGQHKFIAFMEKELPVPVLVKRKNVPLKGIIEINTVRKQWTTSDRVKSYATLGNENYQRLYAIWKELNEIHPIPIRAVAKLCQGSLANSSNKATESKQAASINGGHWKFIKQESDVRKVFNECVKFTEHHKHAMSETFVHCIQMLMEKQPKFSVKRMLTAANKHPHRFVRASRKQDMLRMLEELYNFGRNQNNRLFFDMNNL